MNKKASRRASIHRSLEMIGIGMVLVALLAVLLFNCTKLSARNRIYHEQIRMLEEEIAAEEARTEEIERLPDYIETDEYIEKVAREKLGLIYEDEVIFKTAN